MRLKKRRLPLVRVILLDDQFEILDTYEYPGCHQRHDGSVVGEFRPLQNHSGFLKTQPWIAWVELAWVSIAQVADKIDPPLAIGKECRLQLVSVETGHRPAVQSQSARGQDEVCGLQGTVPKGVLLNQRFISGEVRADIRLRKKPGKILVEFRVPGDDYCHGSGHGLFDIAGRQNWLEEGFCAWRG